MLKSILTAVMLTCLGAGIFSHNAQCLTTPVEIIADSTKPAMKKVSPVINDSVQTKQRRKGTTQSLPGARPPASKTGKPSRRPVIFLR